MGVTYHFVSRSHHVSRGVGLPAFWDNLWMAPAQASVIVVNDAGRIVGWLRYHFDKRTNHFWEGGLWVSRSWRHRGIARQIWEKALRELAPKIVTYKPITRAGRRFVAGLILREKKITFEIVGC